MAVTCDEIIRSQQGKSILLTVEELENFHSDAFYAGHETSRYTPNISGERKRNFVQSEVFDKIKECGNG